MMRLRNTFCSGVRSRSTLSGSLDRKRGGRFHLLLSKRRHFLSPFLSNKPDTYYFKRLRFCVCAKNIMKRELLYNGTQRVWNLYYFFVPVLVYTSAAITDHEFFIHD
jgi:hypothetical protein